MKRSVSAQTSQFNWWNEKVLVAHKLFADTLKYSHNRRTSPKQFVTSTSASGNSHPPLQVSQKHRASHCPPGEITPIAIWRINSVTYGNSKIHLLCAGCAQTRNESRSLVSSLMQNSLWIITSSPTPPKTQKKNI